MRIRHGWIYREPAIGCTPARIRVKIRQNEQEKVEVFNDSEVGATQAAEFVSGIIGDSWKLEDLEFLGYRIVTET